MISFDLKFVRREIYIYIYIYIYILIVAILAQGVPCPTYGPLLTFPFRVRDVECRLFGLALARSASSLKLI